jgi:hypothetical protein
MTLGRFPLNVRPVSRNYKEQCIDPDDYERTATEEEDVRGIVGNQKHSYEAAYESGRIINQHPNDKFHRTARFFIVGPSARNSNTCYPAAMSAKGWKVLGWTLGMALVVWLITNGKGDYRDPVEHILIGAALGLALGFLFTRNWKMNRPFN